MSIRQIEEKISNLIDQVNDLEELRMLRDTVDMLFDIREEEIAVEKEA